MKLLRIVVIVFAIGIMSGCTTSSFFSREDDDFDYYYEDPWYEDEDFYNYD